jgi:hypothetical protein
MRTGAEAGAVEIGLSSKDVVMPDEKPKHTPESVAVKVVSALLKVSPQQKKNKQPKANAPIDVRPSATNSCSGATTSINSPINVSYCSSTIKR